MTHFSSAASAHPERSPVPNQVKPTHVQPSNPQYHSLRVMLGRWLSEPELERIDAAFAFAHRAHAGERRASGEAYIRHPLAVAEILAELRPDAATISAALLHDTIEGKPYQASDLAKSFGSEIAGLVEGATKLDRVKLKPNPWLPIGLLQRRARERLGHERHVESLRKMLLAMTNDIRVILIKLADRLDNMRTLAVLRPDQRQRIAQDTLEIFAPIANRLGMGEWKGELQDLAFPHVYPDEYQRLKRQVDRLLRRQDTMIRQARARLIDELAQASIAATIHGRVKHLYSLWLKLQKHDGNLEQIYDLVALRVIVQSEADCYAALGLVHKLWKPLFGRIKDYVALPKPNGYQSLHTTVFGPAGRILEVQIRTEAMHLQAERGVAAHWLYEGESTTDHRPPLRPNNLSRNELRWIDEIRKWQESLQDIAELKPTLQTDFFSDRIFCFTPAGDVMDLPAGSTPIDFAYQIHTSLGNQCVGAQVDGKQVPLSKPLRNGQIVQIQTSKSQQPRRDWLRFAKTEKARSSIRVHLGEQR